jgi:hypothetical protein
MMKKKIANDEIDLSKVIINIWSNKWTVVLITAITLAIAISYYLINPKKTKSTFRAKTQIQPLSVFDDTVYDEYNTFFYRSFDKVRQDEYTQTMISTYNKTNQHNYAILALNFRKTNLFEKTNLNQIDRIYLQNIFIEKIKQKNLIVKTLKDLNFINKNEFKNDNEYENKISELASSIKISNIKNEGTFISIDYSTTIKSKKIWEQLLNLIEKNANKEIQNFLKKEFNSFVLILENLKRYSIEDIENEILNNSQNEEIKQDLRKIITRLNENKDIERIKSIFNNTPIIKSDNFIAAKFIAKSSDYSHKGYEEFSINNIIIIYTLLGALLGMIYVLIANVIKNQRKI